MNSCQESYRQKFTVHPRNFRLTLGEETRIMGIINVTPDSFSQDGCITNRRDYTKNAVMLARRFIRQGADILDIGGESTRPGSRRISVKEEIRRIIPAVDILSKNIKIPISVDTYKPTVAKYALDAGASMINTIKGVKPEKSLLKMIKHYDAAIVLMHIHGTPRTMQRKIVYKNLVREIYDELKNSIEICLEIGIKSDKIIIDPGIGFGKACEHNLEILNRLEEFKALQYPILIGTSRKSFIGKVLGKDFRHRLFGTAATVCSGILKGAHMIRVHDVKDIKDTVKMTDAIINTSKSG